MSVPSRQFVGLEKPRQENRGRAAALFDRVLNPLAAPGPSPQSTRSHARLASQFFRYLTKASINRTRFLSGTNRQTVKK